MDVAALVLQTAVIVFAVVAAAIHQDRRITKMETKLAPMYNEWLANRKKERHPNFLPVGESES